MPTQASLTFTPLVDNVVWFADADAWNAYLASIRVSISGENLPEPTTVTLGGIYRLHVDIYTPPSVTSDLITIQADVDGSGTLIDYELPSTDMIASLQAKLDQLATVVQNLQTQLNAGNVIEVS